MSSVKSYYGGMYCGSMQHERRLLSVCHLIVFVSLVNTASVRPTSDCTLHPLEAGLSSEMTITNTLSPVSSRLLRGQGSPRSGPCCAA